MRYWRHHLCGTPTCRYYHARPTGKQEAAQRWLARRGLLQNLEVAENAPEERRNQLKADSHRLATWSVCVRNTQHTQSSSTGAASSGAAPGDTAACPKPPPPPPHAAPPPTMPVPPLPTGQPDHTLNLAENGHPPILWPASGNVASVTMEEFEASTSDLSPTEKAEALRKRYLAYRADDLKAKLRKTTHAPDGEANDSGGAASTTAADAEPSTAQPPATPARVPQASDRLPGMPTAAKGPFPAPPPPRRLAGASPKGPLPSCPGALAPPDISSQPPAASAHWPNQWGTHAQDGGSWAQDSGSWAQDSGSSWWGSSGASASGANAPTHPAPAPAPATNTTPAWDSWANSTGGRDKPKQRRQGKRGQGKRQGKWVKGVWKGRNKGRARKQLRP